MLQIGISYKDVANTIQRRLALFLPFFGVYTLFPVAAGDHWTLGKIDFCFDTVQPSSWPFLSYQSFTDTFTPVPETRATNCL